MATTYNYQTRQIQKDFSFVEYGNICRLADLPCKAGSKWCLQYCNHHVGEIHPWSFIAIGFRFNESYVFCKHPEAKDAESSMEAKRAYYEKVEQEALCALCY